MKLPNRSLFFLTFSSLFLLAPACTDDGGDDQSTTEVGDGDGDPGDGDGDPGDGDGDPGDGDGDPGDGDGDGDPGDGDGDPGDGDGDPGDGDGDPGSCEAMKAENGPEECFNPRGWFWNGEACEQIICTCVGDDCNDLFPDEDACLAEYGACLEDPDPECDPFDAKGVGPCDAFFGYSWNGEVCVGISGCECSGTDCDMLYDDEGQCWDDHALCELEDPCAADEAEGVGPCDAFFGWAWDGSMCVGISGCECVGSDCPVLPFELEVCESEHAECG